MRLSESLPAVVTRKVRPELPVFYSVGHYIFYEVKSEAEKIVPIPEADMFCVIYGLKLKAELNIDSVIQRSFTRQQQADRRNWQLVCSKTKKNR